MRSVAVHVDAAVEHGGGVFADAAVDHGASSRVVFDERRDVVNDTSDGNQSASVFRLVLEVVPLHNRKGFERDTPVELGALLIEILLLLLNAALFNLVGTELFQVVSKAELLPHPDGPLGGIILVPFDSVAVVGRKLMMEVVVTFAKGDKSSDHMVTWRVAVIKWLVSKPMSKGVDAEGGLLDKEDAEDATVDEAPKPIAPTKSTDEHRENKTHEEYHL